MRDIALALFVFGMVPFIIMRPFIGLLIWSWLGYMNPNRLCYGFAANFPWVLIVAVITLLALFASNEKKKMPRTTFVVLLAVFLIWTGITSLFAAVPDVAWSKWGEFTKILVMVFVTLLLVNSRERMRWLVWMIVVSIGFYGLKGGIFTIAHGGSYHVVGPARSFIADNNALALALCIIVPLMRFLQLHAKSKMVRMGLGVSMLLTCIAVLGTYSRGGLISLVIVSGALLLKSRRRLTLLMALLVVSAAGLHFMPSKWTARMETLHHASHTDSGETRIQSYKFAANVALHHPILGGGFFVYKSKLMWQNYGPVGTIPRAIHSIYFRVLGEQGFVGLFLFLALLYLSWKYCSLTRRRARGDAELRWAYDLASMLQVSLLAFMTAGAFLPMSYFDLAYQLMALCAILADHVVQNSELRASSEGSDQSRNAPLIPVPQRNVME